MALHLLRHPLGSHCVNQLRRRETNPEHFRRCCDRLTTFLAIEATRDLATHVLPIETPLESTSGDFIDEPVVVVAILRAGAGMIDPIVRLLPDVAVGYVGLERDEQTAVARRYYCKFPPLRGRRVLLVDPMLATGGSANQAIAAIREHAPSRVDFLCAVASPEGVAAVAAAHPDVRIFAAALDRELDERCYIRPGLGDFGDRLYGTL